MRQWYPRTVDEGLDDVHADLPPVGRERWVACNMVASLDGRVTLDGRSGGLGGEGDLAGFRALRAAVDVVLVGAGTARAEGYGPAKVPEHRRAARVARGQAPRPAIAVVTSSLDLDGADRLFDEPSDAPVLVVTHAGSDSEARAALEARGARLVVAGDDEVDLGAALDRLAADGFGRVLCEGGPALNADLLAAGLVDELFVTVAPTLVGGEGPGLAGAALPGPMGLRLVSGREHDGELLLRYAVGVPDPR